LPTSPAVGWRSVTGPLRISSFHRDDGQGRAARPGEVVRINDVYPWLTLLDIEAHPDYAELMDRMFDEVEPAMIGR
jgi:hypothetical protein